MKQQLAASVRKFFEMKNLGQMKELKPKKLKRYSAKDH